ncbi:hypothetical protein [Deinococcus yavapaiensis]|uniref:ATP-binding protein n=1 Tax=Deinococcus yavapaiensis KR-236 TaxID=694435 RepID=A0A318S3B2_9DEIO|nr:hypothetical protein [Deinococcus yavapaiensis]PYE52991.1 hypothetical protein DES52_111164 [Deinococcus yavapaiensis KR-236]
MQPTPLNHHDTITAELSKRATWATISWSADPTTLPSLLVSPLDESARPLRRHETHLAAYATRGYGIHPDGHGPLIFIAFELGEDVVAVVGRGVRNPETGELDADARAVLERLDTLTYVGRDPRDVVALLTTPHVPEGLVEHGPWLVAGADTLLPVTTDRLTRYPAEPRPYGDVLDARLFARADRPTTQPPRPSTACARKRPPSHSTTSTATPSNEPTAEPAKATRESISLLVDRLVQENGGEVFGDVHDRSFVKIEFRGRRETYPLPSGGAERALRHLVYRTEGNALAQQSAREAMLHLATKAAAEGKVRVVAVRVAHDKNVTYLDLGDDDRHVVRVDADGYTVVREDECPVAFLRPSGYAPLPLPTPGGNVLDLGKILNLGDEVTAELVLIVAWLIGVLAGVGPYPILAVSGEAGSGKSFLTLQLRDLVDPRTSRTRSAPRTEQDLVIAAQSHHVVTIDNASSVSLPMSDALCRLATGGVFGTRTLHTTSDETVLEACRPTILNGIPDLMGQADLADRAISITLRRIPDDARRPESVVRAEFEDARASLLGALLDAVAVGLRHQASIQAPSLPRMADFGRLVIAAERALPWPEGTFMATYAGVQAATASSLLDGDEFASTLRSLVEQLESWSGNYAELLDVVTRRYVATHPGATTPRTWPQHAKAAAAAVSRAAPALRKLGVEYRQLSRTAAGARVLLQKVESEKLDVDASGSARATLFEEDV